MPSIQFVLGGARSGKSRFAEETAKGSAIGQQDEGRLVYVATAQIFDDEMRDRVELHQQRRGAEWQLVEAPIDLPETLRRLNHPDSIVLVDCVSVWMTNILVNEKDTDDARHELSAAIADFQGHLVIVASETGLGIVPDNALSRRFRDASGRLNQDIAGIADDVFFVVAGIASKIKSGA